jgi:hypothetical protein
MITSFYSRTHWQQIKKVAYFLLMNKLTKKKNAGNEPLVEKVEVELRVARLKRSKTMNSPMNINKNLHLNISLNIVSRSTKKKAGNKRRGVVDSDSDDKDSEDELSIDSSEKKKPIALKVPKTDKFHSVSKNPRFSISL